MKNSPTNKPIYSSQHIVFSRLIWDAKERKTTESLILSICEFCNVFHVVSVLFDHVQIFIAAYFLVQIYSSSISEYDSL